MLRANNNMSAKTFLCVVWAVCNVGGANTSHVSGRKGLFSSGMTFLPHLIRRFM